MMSCKVLLNRRLRLFTLHNACAITWRNLTYFVRRFEKSMNTANLINQRNINMECKSWWTSRFWKISTWKRIGIVQILYSTREGRHIFDMITDLQYIDLWPAYSYAAPTGAKFKQLSCTTNSVVLWVVYAIVNKRWKAFCRVYINRLSLQC